MPPEEDDHNDTVAAGLSSSDLEEPLLNTQGPSVASPSTTAGGSSRNNDNDTNADQNNDDEDKNVSLICCGRRYLNLNHNVFLNLVLSVVYGMSDSLWSGTVFAAYLKRLGNDANSAVGDVEAINGMAVLLSALPVGYLADVYGRDKLIRAGGLLFVVAALLHGTIMAWIGTDETALSHNQRQVGLVALAGCMALWGVGGGIVSGPAQALYADSTPVGDRSRYYHYLFVTYLAASCLGPIVSIILFQKLGDEWNLYQLSTIIYVGLVMEICNAILMMFFDDSKALEEEEEAENGHRGSSNGTAAAAADTNETSGGGTDEDQAEKGDAATDTNLTGESRSSSDELAEPLLSTTSDANSSAVVPSNGEVAGTDEEVTVTGRRWMIPYILFASGLVFAIGSGMTVKFFPLFFKDEVKLSPSQVQVIYVLVPIVMSLFSGVGTSLSPYLGRVETTLLLQALGISCLYAMVFFKTYLDAHPFVLVPVYVLRTGLMNAPYPLTESVLMDFVPKRERARWKSLESIAQFGWCGSAAAGGYISDRWDYTHTFFVTASVQLVGCLVYATLLPLVPRSEQSLATTTATTTTTNENTTATPSDSAEETGDGMDGATSDQQPA